MKILITGGNGMVGRNVCMHPLSAAHEVVAPSRSELDLSDRSAVKTYFDKVRPDVIIHCAGRVGGIHANVADPAGFLTENLEIGLNTVLSARAAGVTRIINLGSSCMYPRNAPNPLSEEMMLSGHLEPTNEGYALAKIAVARLCKYITETSPGFSYKTIIPCNIYGIYDKFDPGVSHLVPAVVRKIHEAQVNGRNTVEVWGDGTSRREFMFSADLADAIWYYLKEFDNAPDLMNIGTGVDYSIDEYYRTASEVIGWTGELLHDLSRPAGMPQKLVSIEKQEALGWRPQTSLMQGLTETYKYFLAKYC